MKCPFCHNEIEPKAAWKSNSGEFYCTEFCADVELTLSALVNPPVAASQPTR